MQFISFSNLTENDKAVAIEKLITHSTPSSDFFFMMILSVLMATFGILVDSIAVVIGSMLIAPLLSPVLSLSLGIIISDGKLISRSFKTILKSMGYGVFVAMLATLLFGVGKVSAELIALTEPSFLYIGIAIVAGFAATFALVKPKLNEVLPGVAIAIALIPPLAMVGVGIAKWDWALITNSFLLFALNVIGIVFASMITFSLMNFYVKRRVARETIKEEEEKLEEEKELAEYGEKQTENNDDKKIPMEAQQDDSDKLYGKTIDI